MTVAPALVACAAWLAGGIGDAFAEPLEALRDASGRTIGYLQRQGDRIFVKDRCFQTLGWTTKDGTFTDTGIRRAQSPLPSLLLDEPRNCARREERPKSR